MTTAGPADITAAARVLGDRIDHVFGGLAAVIPLVEDIICTARPPNRAALTMLRSPLRELVTSNGGLVDGVGLAVAPGVLDDAGYWLQWWRREDSGNIRFKSHSFNPASLNYYDYTGMDWFQIPVTTNKPALIGPYIDIGGTDLKIITASVPVLHEPGRCSVVAADLSLDLLELIFLRALGRCAQKVVLATKTGKVVASNTSRYATGTLLGEQYRSSAVRTGSVNVPLLQVTDRPWHVLVLD